MKFFATFDALFGGEKRLVFYGPKDVEALERIQRQERDEAIKERRFRAKDLFDIEQDLAYTRSENPKKNVELLMSGALGKKHRDWYMPEIWASLAGQSDRLGKILPERGESPERHHVHTMRLQNGQILFLDQDRNELLRIDISNVFLQRDASEFRYGLVDDWILKRREQFRRRALQRKMGKNLQALFLAASDLPEGRLSPPKTPQFAPPDPEETRALLRVMDDAESAGRERGEILRTFFEDIRSLGRKNYDLEFSLDQSIAPFDDNDWSAEKEGKWKYVEGRREIENLLSEDSVGRKVPSYEEFLKANNSLVESLPEKLRGYVREKDFDAVLKQFREWDEIIKLCEKDSRYIKDNKEIWENRGSIRNALENILEKYGRERRERVYAFNPFKFHRWGADDVRRVVQEGSNAYINFDDVSGLLYEDNFENITAHLKKLGIPEVLLKLLKGDELEEDFKQIHDTYKAAKRILEKPPMEREKELAKAGPEVKAFYNNFEKGEILHTILGDYVVYTIRLVRLISRLKYTPPKRLAEQVYLGEGGNPFKFNRDRVGLIKDKPEMARSKALLAAVFYDDVEAPERYYTLGEKFWKWLSGDDPSERIITMRDFNGKTYSVDRTWFIGIQGREHFTNHLSSDTAYKLVYEYARQKGAPETDIDENEVRDKLLDYLELGIAAYGMRIDDHFHELLERNGVSRTGKRTEDLKKLRDALFGKLNKFFADVFQFQKLHPNFGDELFSDFVEQQRDKGHLSNDVLQFIRLGAVIDLHNKDLEQRETPRAKIRFNEKDADEMVQKLRETNDFSEEELQRIREGLTAGVVVTNNMAGLGAAVPLYHGYYLDLGLGVTDGWSKFGVGAGVGKSFEITESISIAIHAGVVAGKEGVLPGAGIIFRKDYERLSASFVTAATPTGFYAGVGVTRRPEVLMRESIDRAMLEKHITGPDGLEKYTRGQRYNLVSKNPDSYPEFAEVIHALDALGIDEDSKPIIFESFYQLYKQELESNAMAESFPIFRGIGIGGTVGFNPPGFLEFLFPVKFGAGYKTLVYRIADVDGVENLTQGKTREQLIAQYNRAKTKGELVRPKNPEKDVIRFSTKDTKLQVDAQGNLTLSSIKGDYLVMDPFDFEKELRSRVEDVTNIAVGKMDKLGLMPLSLREAYGEIHVNIDPELQNDVLVITDGNQLYLSVSRYAHVYISREDITYPFQREGVVERTYLTIRGNPYLERRGLGGVESRSENYLQRATKENQWEITKNIAFEGEGPEQIMTLDQYRKFLKEKPDFLRDRLQIGDAKEWKEGMKALLEAVQQGSFKEKDETLPRGYEKALAALKANEDFMNGFKEKMTIGYDYKERKASPEWNHNLPKLYEYLKESFAKHGVPSEELGGLALERAVTELAVESFTNIWGAKNPREAFGHYLDTFEKPLLRSMFDDFYKKRGMSDSERTKKVEEIVNYIIAEMKEKIDFPEGKRGEPLPSGAVVDILVGSRGEKDPIVGIRRLHNRHETSEPWGMFYPDSNEYRLDDRGTRGEIARFWVERMSTTAEMESVDIKDDAAFLHLFDFPTETTEEHQIIHEILRSPHVLRLVPYAGIIPGITGKDLKAIAKAYESGERHISFGSDDAKAIRKFLLFAQEVREEISKGKTEMKIEGTNFTIIFNVKVRMGVYAKCGNISAVYEEVCMVREDVIPLERLGRLSEKEQEIIRKGGKEAEFIFRKYQKGRVFVARHDGVIVPELGNARVDFGVFLAPGFTAPKFDEAAGGAPGKKPKPRGPGDRIIPVEATAG